MKNKKLLFILGGVILLLVIIAIAKGGSKSDFKVSIEVAKKRSITETVSASGKIEPQVEIAISSEVSGEIVELLVKEGDQVSEGVLLLRINPDLYQSALNRSNAALLSARANLANSRARLTQVESQFSATENSYKRSKSLHDQGVISDSEYEQALASFEVAKADIIAAQETVNGASFQVQSSAATKKEAQDNLKRTSIYAPQSGTVSGLVVEQGERVVGTGMMGGTEMMRISDLRTMEVDVEVNESDIVRVNLGDTANIEVDAYLNQKFKGIVTEIGNTALNSLGGGISMDQVTNFSVKILILKSSYAHLSTERDSTYSPFRPGMSATVDIITETAGDILSIPIKSVTTREDTSSSGYSKYLKKDEDVAESDEDAEPIICVFIHEDGKAELKAIETGIQDNRYIEIKKGIEEGDEVITGPYEAVSRKLKAGKSVDIKSEDDDEKKNEDE